MRDLPPSLAASLQSGVTTLCRCWRLIRRDGLVLGFTDHDRDLTIDGTVFEAASGLDASAQEAKTGLSTGGGDVSGALTSARIDPKDIALGLLDGASLKSWLVDWQNPTLDFLLEASTLGDIRAMDGQFVAETRNAFHALDQDQGRLYTLACSADLGDARCGIALDDPQYRFAGVITASDGGHLITALALETVELGVLMRGMLTFTSGANAGARVMIKDHQPGGTLILWQSLPMPITIGDEFSVTVGCDKRLKTCRQRFANTLNFRGFPFIPDPDFVLSYARPGEGTHQGRPLIR
jgi:uncharacterized phage protein (TIGR02218 family)